MSNGSRNISLIGFMGSGKSTVGRLLAERLEKRFIDIDDIIEISTGKSISEIFDTDGEDRFRKIESYTIKKIYNNRNSVYACGGGVVLDKENMAVIRKNSLVFYLKITEECVLERLKKDSSLRPLIRDREETDIRELLRQRENLYRHYSDHIVESSFSTPEETCRAMIDKIDG
jgi:shikimate kinase